MSRGRQAISNDLVLQTWRMILPGQVPPRTMPGSNHAWVSMDGPALALGLEFEHPARA